MAKSSDDFISIFNAQSSQKREKAQRAMKKITSDEAAQIELKKIYSTFKIAKYTIYLMKLLSL